MTGPKRFGETELTPKDKFYSRLTEEHITDDEYKRARAVWSQFNLKRWEISMTFNWKPTSFILPTCSSHLDQWLSKLTNSTFCTTGRSRVSRGIHYWNCLKLNSFIFRSGNVSVSRKLSWGWHLSIELREQIIWDLTTVTRRNQTAI